MTKRAAIDCSRWTVVVRDYDGIWHQAHRPWLGARRAQSLRQAILAKRGIGFQCEVWSPAQWLRYRTEQLDG